VTSIFRSSLRYVTSLTKRLRIRRRNSSGPLSSAARLRLSESGHGGQGALLVGLSVHPAEFVTDATLILGPLNLPEQSTKSSPADLASDYNDDGDSKDLSFARDGGHHDPGHQGCNVGDRPLSAIGPSHCPCGKRPHIRVDAPLACGSLLHYQAPHFDPLEPTEPPNEFRHRRMERIPAPQVH
jgi:hypothetical protein